MRILRLDHTRRSFVYAGPPKIQICERWGLRQLFYPVRINVAIKKLDNLQAGEAAKSLQSRGRHVNVFDAKVLQIMKTLQPANELSFTQGSLDDQLPYLMHPDKTPQVSIIYGS